MSGHRLAFPTIIPLSIEKASTGRPAICQALSTAAAAAKAQLAPAQPAPVLVTPVTAPSSRQSRALTADGPDGAPGRGAPPPAAGDSRRRYSAPERSARLVTPSRNVAARALCSSICCRLVVKIFRRNASSAGLE